MASHSPRAGAIIAVLAAVFGATPTLAQQQFNWDDYCTVGGLQFCASVDLSLTPNSDGTQTSVAVRMRNLEGIQGSTPFLFQRLLFGNLQSPTGPVGGSLIFSAASSLTLSGTAGFFCASWWPGPCPTEGSGETDWDFGGQDIPPWYGVPSGFLYMEAGGPGGPVIGDMIGCDMPSGNYANYSDEFFQTCGDGWVGIAFSLPGTWSLDAASSVEWTALTFESGTAEGAPTCFATVDGGSSGCTQVTPEPVTVLLLATGLFGIGAVRRRRRLHDDV